MIIAPLNLTEGTDPETGEKFLFFCDTSSVFCNWYPCNFKHEGYQFNCAEQAMMFAKANFFGDYETGKRIMESVMPSEQKYLGRQVRNYDDAKWAEVRLQIVTDILWSLYVQHPEHAAYLLKTGDKTIVEASPYDSIWGIGLSEGEYCASIRSRWEGQNLLGVALMAVREKLLSRFC